MVAWSIKEKSSAMEKSDSYMFKFMVWYPMSDVHSTIVYFDLDF